MPHFVKPSRVIGRNLVFRGVTPADAEFILSLRTDPRKNRHLSAVSGELQAQIDWLRRYAEDDTQVYFIIEDKAKHPIGTVRLYDQRGESFCWGSWILNGGPAGAPLECALMVYGFAASRGFTRAHFDVRKGNDSVWQFHERFGAKRVAESDLDYHYEIDSDALEYAFQRYRRYLPENIEVHP